MKFRSEIVKPKDNKSEKLAGKILVDLLLLRSARSLAAAAALPISNGETEWRQTWIASTRCWTLR